MWSTEQRANRISWKWIFYKSQFHQAAHGRCPLPHALPWDFVSIKNITRVGLSSLNQSCLYSLYLTQHNKQQKIDYNMDISELQAKKSVKTTCFIIGEWKQQQAIQKQLHGLSPTCLYVQVSTLGFHASQNVILVSIFPTILKCKSLSLLACHTDTDRYLMTPDL